MLFLFNSGSLILKLPTIKSFRLVIEKKIISPSSNFGRQTFFFADIDLFMILNV